MTVPIHRHPPRVTAAGRRNRFAGSLLAGAAGDAFGAPLEFMTWKQIQKNLGHSGVSEPVVAHPLWTDDTQMTLFTVEGLVNGLAAAGGDVDLASCNGDLFGGTARAYLDWWRTQQLDTDAWRASVTGELAKDAALWRRAAPGATCLTSLNALERLGGFDFLADNSSKGCGGVMRMAPVGMLPLASDEATYELGCDLAAITHGHDDGQAPAGALAVLVRALARDAATPREALRRCVAQLTRDGAHGAGTVRDVRRAIELGLRGPVGPKRLTKELGGGWVGDECLAIAVYALLASGGDLPFGLALATNHDGDSDSTGAVAGNLLGAWRGEGELPAWARQLQDAHLLEWAVDRVCEWA
jgi:ADP-ribosylglycohydrolase